MRILVARFEQRFLDYGYTLRALEGDGLIQPADSESITEPGASEPRSGIEARSDVPGPDPGSRRLPSDVNRPILVLALRSQIVGRSNLLDARESDHFQHVLNAPSGRDPFGDVVNTFVGRFEIKVRILFVKYRNGFQIENVRQLGYRLKTCQWILEVVQEAEHEYEIEFAIFFDRELFDLAHYRSNTAQIEVILEPLDAIDVFRPWIHCDDLVRTTPGKLERVEPICAADIENPFTRKVAGNRVGQVSPSVARVIRGLRTREWRDLPRPDAVANLDAVKPGSDLGYLADESFFPQFLSPGSGRAPCWSILPKFYTMTTILSSCARGVSASLPSYGLISKFPINCLPRTGSTRWTGINPSFEVIRLDWSGVTRAVISLFPALIVVTAASEPTWIR